MTDEPPVWDQLFHQCALVAYAEEAALCGGTPGSEAVRRSAYELYEAELRARSPIEITFRRPDG